MEWTHFGSYIPVAKVAKYLRYSARTVLVILTTFWFVFALLSGSEEYGGGIKGLILNSPNALPWLVLGVVVFVAFRWELVGGLLIVCMGVFTVFFFNAYKSALIFYAIPVPLLLVGGFLVVSWYLTKHIRRMKQ